jgi:hypothetical protein
MGVPHGRRIRKGKGLSLTYGNRSVLLIGFGNFDGGYAVPDDVTLQVYSLREVLKVEGVGGVVVGFSSREHILEAIFLRRP